jgi:hypothetical protein
MTTQVLGKDQFDNIPEFTTRALSGMSFHGTTNSTSGNSSS